jgi:protein required for attachment to host cells
MRGKLTWILVADGTEARILESAGPGLPLSVVGTFEPDGQEAFREDSDRPGRVHESADTARHSLKPETKVARRVAQAFARELADRLSAKAPYDRLILVAPPRFLGELKAALPKSVAGRVILTVDKDLTRESDREIARRLAELAPV